MKWDGKKLKALFVRNGKLKLLSLAFACGLWLLVNAGERDAEMTLLMPVELRNLPAQFVVTGPQTDFIDLRLRGPRTLLSQLKSKKIKLDLNGVRPGLSSFRVNADLLSLPRGVKVVRISPAQINLEIARVIKRTVPVRLELMGEPPHGYVVADTQVVPDRIEVTGPAPQVEKFEAVATDTMDVGRLTQSVTQDLSLRGPEGALVTYSPEQVRVQVNIQEVMITREFRRRKIEIKNAPFQAVISPPQADVTVHGPQRLVEELRLNDGEVFVDATGQNPGTATVPVTVLLPPGVELVSQEPTEVELRLVDDSKKKAQNLKTAETKKKPGV
jgi:YbbR domain-containing protein